MDKIINHKDLVECQIKETQVDSSEEEQAYFKTIKQHLLLDNLRITLEEVQHQLLEEHQHLEEHLHLEEHHHLVEHSKTQDFLEITKIQISNKIKEDFLDKVIQDLFNLNKTFKHKVLVI